MANKLKQLTVSEGSLVDKGANPGALVMLFKRDVEKAKWTAAFINDLPDSSFAVISPGGEKDEEGKTKPRSLRHLPYKDGSGAVDVPHLRNALARLDQTDIPDDLKAKAKSKLQAAAKESGIGKSASERIKDFFKNMMGYEEGAKDFDTAYSERTRQDEMWKLDDALRQSICSILDDEELVDKRRAVGEALQQYYNALIDTGIMKAEKMKGHTMGTLKELKTMMDKASAVMQSMMDEIEGNEGQGMKKGSESMPITDEVRNSLPEDVRKHLEEVEAKAAETDELAKKVAELEADLDDHGEDITKGMTDDVKKAFDDMQARIEKAEKDASAERELRLEREYLAKAEEMPYAGAKDEVVKILRAAYEVGTEHGELVEKNLRAASERIEKGDLFKELGRGGESDNSAEAQIDKLAKAKAEKDGITYEKAYTQVLKSAEGIKLQAELSREVN